MTRQQRRAAERKARKLQNKNQSTNPVAPQPIQPTVASKTKAQAIEAAKHETKQHPNRATSASESNTPSTRAGISRQNAQLSTGPRTAEGKAASSQNAIRHGLASNRFYVLPWENEDDFHDLLNNLRQEHQPQTQTEALLVEKLAQHFWLSQRALHLQSICFRPDLPVCDQQKELALYIRYQTTNDRAFHKTLATLKQLQKQRQTEPGFVSQTTTSNAVPLSPVASQVASVPFSTSVPLPFSELPLIKNPIPNPKEFAVANR